jgi:3-oxoacyl-[acyl-carrier-protein] synthase-3
MSCFSALVGCSSYLPEKVLTNDDLSRSVETSNEWIETRTGIRERHIAAPSQTTSDMAVVAVESLLRDCGAVPEDIDMLVVATATPDFSFPSVACVVQGRTGLRNAICFDISAACSGFIYALSVVDAYIRSGSVKSAIVIGADKMSSLVDWSDRATCILFGDGAGGVLLKSVKNPGKKESHLISSQLYSDGSMIDLLKTTGGVGTTGNGGFVAMNGREVFRNAVNKMTESTREILLKNDFSVEDLDLIVPHQANVRIIDAVAGNLKIPSNKMVVTIDVHGNTSAASIPLAMHSAIKDGRLKAGNLVLLQAVGGGLTWGSALLRF